MSRSTLRSCDSNFSFLELSDDRRVFYPSAAGEVEALERSERLERLEVGDRGAASEEEVLDGSERLERLEV